MIGKVSFSIGLVVLCTTSLAGVASVFDLNGTLDPTFNNGHAKSLEFFKGGPNPVPVLPVFVNDTVGSTFKQVAKFDKTEGFKVFHGVGKNGGGVYANLFTILMDIKLTDTSGN